MKETKTVLIVEDEEAMAGAIAEGLARSSAYDFQVEIATSPRDYLKKRLDSRTFDVHIIDLELVEGRVRLCGLMVIAIRSREHVGALILAYSQYDQTPNVVKAMELGATDFIPKRDCPPHKLVTRVEQHLDEGRRRLERVLVVEQLVADHQEEWSKQYPGEFIVLVEGEVVTSGATQLEALVKYDELMVSHPDWPEQPDLVPISGKEGQL